MKIFQLKIIYFMQENYYHFKVIFWHIKDTFYFLQRKILIGRQKGVDEIKLYFLDFNPCKLNNLIFVLETFI